MNFFHLSKVLKSMKNKRDLLIPNTENIIFFNSEFESGNLYQAIRVADFEYNLYLEFDKNSRNYTQWYYFSWRNVKKVNIFVLLIGYDNKIQYIKSLKSRFLI